MSRSFVRPAVVVVSLLVLFLPFTPPAHGHSAPATAEERTHAVPAYGSPEFCTGGGGFHICAWLSDYTPAQYTTVTVSSYCWGSVCELVPGPWTTTAAWHFESGTQFCAATGMRGEVVSCSLNIGAATLGRPVEIIVNNMVSMWFTPAVDCSTVTAIAPGECRALEALAVDTNLPEWTNHDGWLTADTPCAWYGVMCDGGHVSGLNLSSNHLGKLYGYACRISPELGNLTALQTLNLSSNTLCMSIPAELGQLLNLRELDLSSNDLTEGIPSQLGNLTTLQTLNLSSNQLSGSIPPQLGNLTALTSLSLQFNQLRGCLPQSLTNLLALQQFHFDTDRLWIPDNAAFAAWLAGIPDTSAGVRTCRSCYLPAVTHWTHYTETVGRASLMAWLRGATALK